MTSVVHDVHSVSPLFTGGENHIPSNEQEMVRRLADAGFHGRDDALQWLKESIRQCDGSRIPFSDPVSVFQGLSVAVEDDEWDTRYQCVKVVGELVPLLDSSDLEPCMHEVLPQMICRLGDTKVTVSMAAACALGTYAECATDIQILYDAIVQYGLKADDDKLKQAIIEVIPSLLEGSQGCHPNLQRLIATLIELTYDTQFRRPVEMCLNRISSYVGLAEFNTDINRLPKSTQEQYSEIQSDGVISANTQESPDMLSVLSDDHDSPVDSAITASVQVSHENLKKTRTSSGKGDVLYGFIPSKIVNSLSNRDDNRSISRAVEELRTIVSDSEKVDSIEPHMSDFLDFLSSLLDDGVSFQVIVVTLDVIGIVMLHVNSKTAASHARQVTTFLISRMVDPNMMVRRAVIQLAMRLMQATSPVIVINILSDGIRHKSPRVRQVTVDIVTAALLTRPRSDFDLPALCSTAVPALVDQKKSVRHAAMECVAVIAQALGAGKLQPLMSEIELFEAEPRFEGLMDAVQARLARRQLPSFNNDGLVEYAVLSSASSSTAVTGDDIDWVKCGSFCLSSPAKSDLVETKPRIMSPASRRNVGTSAKSLSKLPWEKEAHEASYFAEDKTKFVRQYSERAVKQPSPEIAPPCETQTFGNDTNCAQITQSPRRCPISEQATPDFILPDQPAPISTRWTTLSVASPSNY